MHLTSQQIARKTGIHRLSVVYIVPDDLRFQVCEKNDVYRSSPRLKQIVSTVSYKINLSWFPVSSKLAITPVNIGDLLLIFLINFICPQCVVLVYTFYLCSVLKAREAVNFTGPLCSLSSHTDITIHQVKCEWVEWRCLVDSIWFLIQLHCCF